MRLSAALSGRGRTRGTARRSMEVGDVLAAIDALPTLRPAERPAEAPATAMRLSVAAMYDSCDETEVLEAALAAARPEHPCPVREEVAPSAAVDALPLAAEWTEDELRAGLARSGDRADSVGNDPEAIGAESADSGEPAEEPAEVARGPLRVEGVPLQVQRLPMRGQHCPRPIATPQRESPRVTSRPPPHVRLSAAYRLPSARRHEETPRGSTTEASPLPAPTRRAESPRAAPRAAGPRAPRGQDSLAHLRSLARSLGEDLRSFRAGDPP